MCLWENSRTQLSIQIGRVEVNVLTHTIINLAAHARLKYVASFGEVTCLFCLAQTSCSRSTLFCPPLLLADEGSASEFHDVAAHKYFVFCHTLCVPSHTVFYHTLCVLSNFASSITHCIIWRILFCLLVQKITNKGEI